MGSQVQRARRAPVAASQSMIRLADVVARMRPSGLKLPGAPGELAATCWWVGTSQIVVRCPTEPPAARR